MGSHEIVETSIHCKRCLQPRPNPGAAALCNLLATEVSLMIYEPVESIVAASPCPSSVEAM